MYYAVYIRFEERDSLGKRMGKSILRINGKLITNRLDAETLFDSVVSECQSKMVDATVDLIDLSEAKRLQRVTVDESTARREWFEFFSPIVDINTY